MDNILRLNWQGRLNSGFEKHIDQKKRFCLDMDGIISYNHNVDFDIIYDNTTANLSLVKTIETGLIAKLNYRYKTFSAGITGKFSGRFSRSDRTDFSSITDNLYANHDYQQN